MIDVEALARQAGFDANFGRIFANSETGPEHADCTSALARFAALVAERCARIADSEYLTRPPGKHIRTAFPMPKE